ncbi:unnamed protein product [Allacma fusca]|uniref:tRNA-guanine(15) transglycosylase-like domain-containing protein n=1 Tax=Allacma fusca TaxID=39272 RepID=A0A8J2LLX2_9HEXA|nr:unnamed protein product [Allacma fusca]
MHYTVHLCNANRRMKQMKFVVEKCSEAASRLGHLELQKPSGGVNGYASPLFFIHTLAGSVPHITREVFDMMFDDQECKPPVQMSIDTTYSFHEAVGPSGMNLSKFVGLEDSPCLLTVLNPAENFLPGYNDKRGISIWPRLGRRTLDLKTFTKIVTDFQPCAYQCMNDYDVSSVTMEKRLKKSTARSVDYLNEVIANSKESKSSLWVPVEPAWFLVNEEEGEKTLAALLENRDEFQAFVVKRNYDETVDFLESFRKISRKLPTDKFRYVSGVFSLSEIIELVLEGVDAFDSSIITQLSEDKKALVLPLDKRAASVNERLPTVESGSDNLVDDCSGFILDLKDKK